MVPLHDDEITIGSEEIYKRGANDIIFRTYKPIQVLKYYCDSQNLKLDNGGMRINGQAKSSADANVYSLEVFDKKQNSKFKSRQAVTNKVQGSLHTSLNILNQIFGPNYNWLQLVDETKDRIDQARLDRGAPDRPVFKKSDVYLREFSQNQMGAFKKVNNNENQEVERQATDQ